MTIRNRRRSIRSRGLASALGLLLVLGFGACARSTGPTPTGEFRLFFSDDPGAIGLASLVHHKTFGDNYFHGVLAATVSVSLSVDGATWVEATVSYPVEVDLQSAERRTPLLAPDVPAGTYRHLRLRLQDASVLLAPGAEIGGLELTASERVLVHGGEAAILELEMPPLTVAEGGSAELAIDLNAERWVIEDHVVAGSIPAVAVARAIAVAAAGSSRRL